MLPLEAHDRTTLAQRQLASVKRSLLVLIYAARVEWGRSHDAIDLRQISKQCSTSSTVASRLAVNAAPSSPPLPSSILVQTI